MAATSASAPDKLDAADVARLHHFANAPPSAQHAAQAAHIITRLTRQFAAAAPVPPDHMSAARAALQALAARPDAHAAAPLLATCEHGCAAESASVFVLSSLAWKALSATCIKCCAHALLRPSLKLAVLACALRSALRVLPNVAARRATAGQAEAARLLKIARFHLANAARCARAFVPCTGFASEEGEALAGLLGLVLNVVGVLSEIRLWQQAGGQLACEQVVEQLAPPAGLALRSVLGMLPSVRGAGGGEGGAALLARALGDVGGAQEPWVASDALAREPSVLLALLHVVRYAVSSAQRGDTVADAGDTAIALCRSALLPTILPLAFQRFQRACPQLCCSERRNLGLLFVQSTCSTLEQAFLFLYTSVPLEIPEKSRVEDLLLANLQSTNSLQMLVASRCILRLSNNRGVSAQMACRLLLKILRCAHLSLLVCPGYSERRWIPLAATLAHTILSRAQPLKPVFQAYSRMSSSVHSSASELVDFKDPLFLRVVASMAGLCLSQKAMPDTLPPSPEKTCGKHLDLSHILDALDVDKTKLTMFVQNVVVSNNCSDAMASAALHILPYLVEPRASSHTAICYLKRKDTCCRAVRRALNNIDPGQACCTSLQEIWVQIEQLVGRYGTAISPVVVALVERASIFLHRNVSVSSWGRMGSLLALTVCKPRASSTENSTVLQNCLRRAAILFHASGVLSAINASIVSGSNRNTRLTVPKEALSVIEDADVRFRQMRGSEHVMGHVDENPRHEVGVIEKEMRECGSVSVGRRDVKVSGERDVQLSIGALRRYAIQLCAQSVGGGDVDGEKGVLQRELGQIQDIMHAFGSVSRGHT